MSDHIVREGNKAFLKNDLADYGSVCWWVSARLIRESDDKEKFTPVKADLRISDCAGSVYLNFSADDLEDYNNRIEKLDQLIKELSDFRLSYLKAKGAL